MYVPNTGIRIGHLKLEFWVINHQVDAESQTMFLCKSKAALNHRAPSPAPKLSALEEDLRSIPSTRTHCKQLQLGGNQPLC